MIRLRLQFIFENLTMNCKAPGLPDRLATRFSSTGTKLRARRSQLGLVPIADQNARSQRPQKGVAIAAEIVEAELVAHDEQNVARRSHFPSRLQSDPKQHSKMTDQSAFQLFSSSGRSKPLAAPPPLRPLLVLRPEFLADALDIPARSDGSRLSFNLGDVGADQCYAFQKHSQGNAPRSCLLAHLIACSTNPSLSAS